MTTKPKNEESDERSELAQIILEPEWHYEISGGRDSSQKARILFFESIQRLHPSLVTELREIAFPAFIAFVEEAFLNCFDQRAKVSDHCLHGLRLLRQIPEHEIRGLNWLALQRTLNTSVLRSKILEWAGKNNVDEEWCYDFALAALRSWLYDIKIYWIGKWPEPQVQQNSFIPWTDVLRKMEFDLASARTFLLEDVFGEGPPPLRLDESWEHPGWNFLQVGKQTWKADVIKEFKRHIAERTANGETVPKGILSQLDREISDYLAKQDAELALAIKKHGLVKRSRQYAEGHELRDHIDWVVKYQIPECWDCSQIAEEAKVGKDTVLKAIKGSAKMLDLKLRGNLRRGRPLGVLELQRRNRVTSRRGNLSNRSVDK